MEPTQVPDLPAKITIEWPSDDSLDDPSRRRSMARTASHGFQRSGYERRRNRARIVTTSPGPTSSVRSRRTRWTRPSSIDALGRGNDRATSKKSTAKARSATRSAPVGLMASDRVQVAGRPWTLGLLVNRGMGSVPELAATGGDVAETEEPQSVDRTAAPGPASVPSPTHDATTYCPVSLRSGRQGIHSATGRERSIMARL